MWLKQKLFGHILLSKKNSNNSAKDLNLAFEQMFPDSAIASEFQLGRDKLKYLTNWGIAPYFNDQLKTDLSKAEYIVISCDESLNHITQTCQIDIVLHYWDKNDQQVKVWYWESKFLGHAACQDLLTH